MAIDVEAYSLNKKKINSNNKNNNKKRRLLSLTNETKRKYE